MMVAEIVNRLNQLNNGLIKLECDIFTIYKYIDSLSNKKFTPKFVKPMNLKNYIKQYAKSVTKIPEPT